MMKLLHWILITLIFSLHSLVSVETTLKVKTTPAFPEGLPPQIIVWDGVEVGTTNPGQSVAVSIDLTKKKKNLVVGEATVVLWKAGMGIKGEVVSGNAKMKKGPTIIIKSKLSSEEILLNALDYFPVIQKKLNEDLEVKDKVLYSSLLANVLNYEFTTENIIANITGLNPEDDEVYINFSYFGPEEKSWNDTLKLNKNNFSGKKPKAGTRAQVFSEHFKSIAKHGILKMTRQGKLELTVIKTDKYKWGTYKKKKKKKKKYILPITFYSK